MRKENNTSRTPHLETLEQRLLLAAVNPVVSLGTVTSSTVNLNWNSISGATAVRVYIAPEPPATPGAALPAQKLMATLGGSVTSYQLTNLAANVGTYIRVEVDNGGGTGSTNLYTQTVGGQEVTLDNNHVREVHMVAPNILQMVVTNYISGYPTEIGNTGASLQSGAWTVTRETGSTISVTNKYRFSKVIDSPNYDLGVNGVGGGTYTDQLDLDHTIYLVLGANVGNRDVLTITGPNGININYCFSDQYSETPAIQVNQVGYNPRATERWAYVGGYMGDGGGLPLAGMPATANVLIQSTDPLVPRTTAVSSLAITQRSANDPESGGAVDQINLMALSNSPGVRYRVQIPGVGVSWPTAVSEEAAFKAYYTVTRGLYLNRWAGDLSQLQYTEWTRPQDHTGQVYNSTTPWPNNAIPSGTPQTGGRQVLGGHHDAGDWDFRSPNTLIAQFLMRAYEENPSHFTDSQLTTPQSGNGIPDLLDEALWEVQAWEGLQEASGGVHSGVQWMGDGCSTTFASDDPNPWFAYALDPQTTARAAGIFAEAAYDVKPFNAARSAQLQTEAINAYNWANNPANKDFNNASAAPAYLMYAAGELYRLTGSTTYKSAFEANYNALGVTLSNFNGSIRGDDCYMGNWISEHVGMPDYLNAYIHGANPDATIVSTAKTGLSTHIDAVYSDTENAHAYRSSRPAGTIMDWGNGTVPNRYADDVNAAASIGGRTGAQLQQDFNMLSLNADYILGCNPAGFVYITGLGSRHATQPLHTDSEVWLKLGQGQAPGIPEYGPVNVFSQNTYYLASDAAFYPSSMTGSALPPAYRFADAQIDVNCSEFDSSMTQTPLAELFANLLGAGWTAPPTSYLPGGSDARNTLPTFGSATNRAPLVLAGANQVISIGNNANLVGQAVDDSFPGTTLTKTWSVVSGPGTVSFANANSLTTTASFSMGGLYTLKLTANDTLANASSTMTVKVNDPALGIFLNGNFENGIPAAGSFPYGWSGGDVSTCQVVNNSVGGAGNYVLHVTTGDWKNVLDLTPQRTSGVQQTNTTYTVRFKIKFNTVTTKTVTCNAMDNNYATINSLSVTGSDTNWHDYSFTFNSGSNNNFYISFWHAGEAGAARDYYLDNIYVLGPGQNTAPYVFAGNNQTITMPSAATLSGVVTDDGLPSGTTTCTWSKVGGPGTVTFGNMNAASTTATFSTAGVYQLRLTGSDGSLSSYSDTYVTVNSNVNTAPTVNAGSNQVITLPTSVVNLSATVTDDGLPTPPGTCTYTWTKTSGPGTVTFGSPTSKASTATINTAGTYVLRLTANDSALSGYGELTVVVNPQLSGIFTNGDFESGVPQSGQFPAGYTGSCNPSTDIAVVSAAANGGVGTWDLHVIAPDWKDVIDNSPQSTSGVQRTNTNYELRFKARFNVTTTKVVNAQIIANDGSVLAAMTFTGSDTNWHDYTLAFNSGINDKFYVAFTHGGESGTARDYWLDNIAVVSMASNQPPVVSIGANQTIELPTNQVTLVGTVTDDGLPNPPGTCTYTWTQTSGPGTVTFGSPNATTTTATFAYAGTFVLRLTASDSDQTGYKETTITVQPTNGVPTVSAGNNLTIAQTDAATLNGSVTDDGYPNPPGTTTCTWSMTSGPGTVTFANPNAVDTTATFSAAGTYVVRLTGSDSLLSAWSQATIVVTGVDTGIFSNGGFESGIPTPGQYPAGYTGSATPGTDVTVVSASANGGTGLYDLHVTAPDWKDVIDCSPQTGVVRRTNTNYILSWKYKFNTTTTKVVNVNIIANDGSTLATTTFTGTDTNWHTGTLSFNSGINDRFYFAFTHGGDSGNARDYYLDEIYCTSNSIPVTANDSYSTNENTQLLVTAPGILANDSDPSGGTLTASVVANVSHGTLSLNGNGGFTYTPSTNWYGTDSFTYKVNDGYVDSNVSTVTITVNQVIYPPVANSDSYSVNENAVLTVAAPGVLSNDTDPQSRTLTAAVVANPTHGTLTFTSNGGFTYTPSSNWYGTDSFTYKANNGTWDSNQATVTLTVSHVNQAPVATGESYTVTYNTALTVAAPGVLSNDTDVDLDTLTAVKVANPAHGTLTLNSNGSFTYTPSAGYSGADSFTYYANDSHVNSNTVTVNLTVNTGLPTPMVNQDIGSVGLAGSSTYSGGTYTVKGAGADIYGTADAFQYAYQPLHGDGTFIARVATITNTDPWAKAGIMVRETLAAGSTNATIEMCQSGPAFQYRTTTNGNTTAITGSALVPYWVKLVRSGNSFSGYISSNGTSWTQLGTTQTISMATDVYVGLAVTAHTTSALNTATFDNVSFAGGTNQAPVVSAGPNQNVQYPAVANLAGTATDDGLPNGSTVTTTWSVVSGPGSVTFGNVNALATTAYFSSVGSYVLKLTASDGQLQSSSTVTITSAVHTSIFPNGGFENGDLTGFSGDTANTVVVANTVGGNGNYVVHVTSGDWKYPAIGNAPQKTSGVQQTNTNYTFSFMIKWNTATSLPVVAAVLGNGDLNLGQLSIKYTDTNWHTYTIPFSSGSNNQFYFVFNHEGGGDVARDYYLDDVMVYTTTSSGNHAPVATNDSYTVNENAALTVAAPGVLSNDTDQDLDPLMAAVVATPSHGTLTLNTNGSFTYTPSSNWYGTDSFTYKANDGQADSNVATVTLTVNHVNQAPVATTDTYSTTKNTALTVAAPGVLSNDTDVDGDTLTAIAVANPSHGTLTLNSNGSFTYTPSSGYVGSDSFTYKPNDSHVDGNTMTVNLTVSDVNTGIFSNGGFESGIPPVGTYPTGYTGSATPGTDVTVVSASGNGGTGTYDLHVTAPDWKDVIDCSPQTGVQTINTNYTLTWNYKFTSTTTKVVNVNIIADDQSVLATTTFTGSDTSWHTKTLNFSSGNNSHFYFAFTHGGEGGNARDYYLDEIYCKIATIQSPRATNDSYSTNENTQLTVSAPGVLTNDSDPQSYTLTAIKASDPSHGTVTFNSNGSYTYTPATNWYGTDSFTYMANNGSFNSTPATVTITVNKVNYAPTAGNDSYTTNHDTPLVASTPGVLGNDTDPNNDPLTAVVVTNPSHGTLSLASSGGFTYTPSAGYSGADSFTYKAYDGVNYSSPATVSITINGSLPFANWPDVPNPRSSTAPLVYDQWMTPYMSPNGQAWVNTIDSWYTQGSAAGLTQDNYRTYDGAHAELRMFAYPQLHEVSPITSYDNFANDVLGQRVTFANQSFGSFNNPLLDDSPCAIVEANNRQNVHDWYAYGTIDVADRESFYSQWYNSNALLIQPSVQTYPDSAHDKYTFLSPNYLQTIGHSGSDCYLMKPIIFASAALPPAVKTAALRNGVYVPLLMNLFKSNITGNGLRDANANVPSYILPAEADATSGPTPFLDRLINAAHNLAHVPPVARISIENVSVTGGNYTRGAYYDSSMNDCFIGCLRPGETMSITLNMGPTWTDSGQSIRSYYSAILRGTGASINYLNGDHSRMTITVPYMNTGSMSNNRTDIMLLANDGMYDSAPAYISIHSIQSGEASFFGT